MKKGCFVGGIIIFTTVVIIGLYFYKTHKTFFTEFGRDRIISKGLSEISERLDSTIHSPYKDSLNTLIHAYKLKKKDPKFENAMEEFSDFIRKIQIAIKDKQVDSLEFAELKHFVKDYERSKKDRN